VTLFLTQSTSQRRKNPITCPEKDLKNTNAKGIYFYRFFGLHFKALK